MSNAVVTDWPSGSANTGWPGEPTGMLMPGRVEGWPAGTQRAANAAERLLSQAVAWWDVGQYRDGDRFLRNRGTGGELLDLRLGSALAPNSNDPRFLAPEDQGYVYLPGVAQNYLSVPDENALDISGDMDLRVRVALDSWVPSAIMRLAGKYGVVGQRSYLFDITTAGLLRLSWTADGSTAQTASSSVATGIPAGSVAWVRVTLDADNGAGKYEVKFFTSSDGSIWTQLGTTTTGASTTSVFNSTSAFVVASDAVAGAPAAGKFYQVVLYSDLTETTKVLDIDCDAITSGSASSFTAVTGQTVTINRSTSGRKSVAMPSRFRGGQPVMLLGTDDYLEVQDNWQHGLLNFGQGDSFTLLAVVREWATPISISGPISKRIRSATDAGYYLRHASAAFTYETAVTSGASSLGNVSNVAVTSPASSAGALNVTSATLDRTANVLTPYTNAVAGTSANVKAVGSLDGRPTAGNVPFRVGNVNSGANAFADMELYAIAVFRRALSPAEITALSNYFTGRIA